MAYPIVPAILVDLMPPSSTTIWKRRSCASMPGCNSLARLTTASWTSSGKASSVERATGGQGNEWMIVLLALLADKKTDVVSFTHRDFGGHLVWAATFAST